MIFRGTFKFFKFHFFHRIGHNLKFRGFYYYLECKILKYLLNFLKDFIYVGGIWFVLENDNYGILADYLRLKTLCKC